MRPVLFAAVILLAALPAYTQSHIAPQLAQDNVDVLRANIERVTGVIENARRLKAIEEVLGGLAVAADRMDLDASGKVVYAIGHVRIRMNEVIIEADDAIIRSGDIRLGANAHVVIDYPIKMVR